LDFNILFPSVLGGLTTGAVYALIALGLTLIYGVLHIINFAHGALLMVALYAVYLLKTQLGIDPYLALPLVVPGMFALGYALQRGIINRASHGKDENILLVTLGLSIVLENLALMFFKSDTRSIDTAYTLSTVQIGPAFIAVPTPSKRLNGNGFVVHADHVRLVVKRIDLAWAAVHKQKDHRLGFGLVVWFL
jgi:branched-chain amino acid transport system permease protein